MGRARPLLAALLTLMNLHVGVLCHRRAPFRCQWRRGRRTRQPPPASYWDQADGTA
jgi:hypothetical protein